MQGSTELMGSCAGTPTLSGSRDFAVGPPAAAMHLESPAKGAKLMTTPQSVLDPSAFATPESATSCLDGPSPLAFRTPSDLPSLRHRLTTRVPPKENLTFRGFLDDADPSSPSSVSTPKLAFSDSPAADGQQHKGARPHHLSNSDPTPFPFEPSPSKVPAKKIPRVPSNSDLTNEMRRISLARPDPTDPSPLGDTAPRDPEPSPSSQGQQQQPPIPVSSPVKQKDAAVLVSPFANNGTEDLPPWATPAAKSPPSADSKDGAEDSAYLLTRQRSSITGNSDFLRDIFSRGCHENLPDYVMRGADSMRDRDDSPMNYASVKEASGDLCQALNLLDNSPGGTPGSNGRRARSRSTDGNGASSPITTNSPMPLSRSEEWANNGMRMLNRAPSTYGGGEDDMVPIEASSPHTPHTPDTPDPGLIIQGTPWGGDCPPTPVQQRVRTARIRTSVPVSPNGKKLTTSRESLCDDKVLIQTSQLIMERTESYVHPEMFKFQNHFDFLRSLGNSKLSEVWAVRHKTRGDMYAVKKTRREFQSKGDRERCMREILAVSALPTHPNVVGQYRAWQQGGHFYIQMDLCSGGSLAGILQKLRAAGEQLEEEAIWGIMRDVSKGLQFLHSHGVAHLDIKPDNIYQDAQGRFRVGDFGQAVLRNEWTAEEGDGDYVAPEFLQNNTKPAAPADVFSLGVTMYECATLAKLPRSGAGRLPENVSMPGRSSELQQVIRDMIAERPSDRPLAMEIAMRCSVEGNAAESPPPSAAMPPLPRAADSPPVVVAPWRGVADNGSSFRNPCVTATPRLKRRSTQDLESVGSGPIPPRRAGSSRRLQEDLDMAIEETPDVTPDVTPNTTPTKAQRAEMPSPSSVFASPVSEKEAPWGTPAPAFCAESPNLPIQNHQRRHPSWGDGVFSYGSCSVSPCPSFTSMDGNDISLELSFDSPPLC